jgi:hypothetical protein
LRTRVNVTTKKSIREVVDGQQRLRAILDFAENKFRLSKRATEFAGKRYSDLTEKQQENFLGYPIAVDQLVNASVDDVLEVFARLNSYTVTLNGPEKRHARFQGDFKWAVRTASRRWADLWKKVLTVRERVRMLDDSLTAEMVGILLAGVTDGGQPKIDAMYRRYDKSFKPGDASIKNLDTVPTYIAKHLADHVENTPLMRPPHFLMLFSGVAAILIGIPRGELTAKEWHHPRAISNNLDNVRDNLLTLASVIDRETEPEEPYGEFWRASRSSTQRIASRRIRFPFFVRALGSGKL